MSLNFLKATNGAILDVVFAWLCSRRITSPRFVAGWIITSQDEIVSELFIQLQIGNCCFDERAPNIIGDRDIYAIIRIELQIRGATSSKLSGRVYFGRKNRKK